MHGSTQWSTSRGKASSIVPRWRKSPLQKVDPTKSHFLSVIFQQLELKAETFYFILFISLIACLFVCLLCFSHYWSFNPDVKCRVFIQEKFQSDFFPNYQYNSWLLRRKRLEVKKVYKPLHVCKQGSISTWTEEAFSPDWFRQEFSQTLCHIVHIYTRPLHVSRVAPPSNWKLSTVTNWLSWR